MARSRYGGTSVDWLFKPYRIGSVRVLALRFEGTTLKFYDQQIGGNQYTDLRDADNNAVDRIRVTSYQIPVFWGPDAVAGMWADKGDGSAREFMTANDSADLTDTVAAVNAARDQVLATVPVGTASALRVPWRNSGNTYAWGAASEVVAAGLGWVSATDPTYGADNTGSADATSALNAAAAAAAAAGKTLYAQGVFRISGTVTIKGDADLARATFNSVGGGTAVTVGVSAAFTIRRRVFLPRIVNTLKTANGWAQTGVSGSVGVLIQNCYNVDLTIPHVQSFDTGVRVAGFGNGTSYCNITLGHLDNNKVNLHFTADATGWANQNQFFGGRLSHNSNEGTIVSGTRHVLMDLTASKVNNNTFYSTSLESPNVVEYHLDCAGNDNYWMDCRWENTGSGARIIWRANSIGNCVSYGFGSHTIVETKEASTANHLLTRARGRMIGDGAALGLAVLALENSAGSASAALRVMEAGAESAGTSQTTGWAVELSAQKLRGKRATDSFERVILDLVNGRLYFGAGTATTTRYIGNVGTSLGIDGASLVWPTDNTYDVGATSLKPRYVRAGTAVQVGAFATGSRPAASTAGAGAMIFDSTLGKPVWSTGTGWVDATGASV